MQKAGMKGKVSWSSTFRAAPVAESVVQLSRRMPLPRAKEADRRAASATESPATDVPDVGLSPVMML
jgi:hypothetical protein